MDVEKRLETIKKFAEFITKKTPPQTQVHDAASQIAFLASESEQMIKNNLHIIERALREIEK